MAHYALGNPVAYVDDTGRASRDTACETDEYGQCLGSNLSDPEDAVPKPDLKALEEKARKYGFSKDAVKYYGAELLNQAVDMAFPFHIVREANDQARTAILLGRTLRDMANASVRDPILKEMGRRSGLDKFIVTVDTKIRESNSDQDFKKGLRDGALVAGTFGFALGMLGWCAAVALGAAAAPVLITVAAVAVVGGAAYSTYKRVQSAKEAGVDVSLGKATLVGLGDVAGVTGIIEGYTREDAITGRELSGYEAGFSMSTGLFQTAGTVTGLIAAGAKGAGAFKPSPGTGSTKVSVDLDQVGRPLRVISGGSGQETVPAHKPLTTYSIRPGLQPMAGDRTTGVNRAWKLERELVRITGQGTRDWSLDEVQELITVGKVSGYSGHHINNVEAFPAWQGDPRNIRFLPNTPGGGEHRLSMQGHRGDWRNTTSGRLIDREAMINQFLFWRGRR